MGTTVSFFEIEPQRPGPPLPQHPGGYQLLMVDVMRAELGRVPAVTGRRQRIRDGIQNEPNLGRSETSRFRLSLEMVIYGYR